MSAYPFVQSFTDLGPRRGPVLGFVVHMAEGGGTVGYLAKANPNGVSVHYVIEYSGRIVQMLREDRMHSSLRSSAIRQTDDADRFYGSTARRAVLGDWGDVSRTLGPNHSTIGLEIEGFALNGPNASQRAALVALGADLRARHTTMRGNLGHRDFADYKACPGKLIPWAAIGGHGLYASATGGSMPYTVDDTPFEFYAPAGVPLNLYHPDQPGGSVGSIVPGPDFVGQATRSVNINWTPGTDPGAPSGGPFLLVLSPPEMLNKYILRSAVSLEPAGAPSVPPVADCAAAIAADRAKARIVWS